MNAVVTTRHATYLKDIFLCTDALLGFIETILARHDYDTIVGTGVSGCLLLLPLRERLKKHIAVVRKPRDGSHSFNLVEGTLGSRYVIVDDQVSSGQTVNNVIRAIHRQLHDYEPQHRSIPIPTFVGVCCYASLQDDMIVPSWIDADDFRFDESRQLKREEPTPYEPYEPPKVYTLASTSGIEIAVKQVLGWNEITKGTSS
jgi:hypothetical protein